MQIMNLHLVYASVKIDCLQLVTVQIIGSMSEVFEQIHNLSHVTCTDYANMCRWHRHKIVNLLHMLEPPAYHWIILYTWFVYLRLSFYR